MGQFLQVEGQRGRRKVEVRRDLARGQTLRSRLHQKSEYGETGFLRESCQSG
jgi:hypothetical protein